MVYFRIYFAYKACTDSYLFVSDFHCCLKIDKNVRNLYFVTGYLIKMKVGTDFFGQTIPHTVLTFITETNKIVPHILTIYSNLSLPFQMIKHLGLISFKKRYTYVYRSNWLGLEYSLPQTA